MAKGATNLTTKTHPPAEEPGSNVVPLQGGALPAHLASIAKERAGQGGSTDAADNVVPIVRLLQTNSPQVNKRDEKYVSGAEPGDILLKGAPRPVVKGEGKNAGFLFQPCWFDKCVNEWIPRNTDGSGGGFVARHKGMPQDAEAKEFPGKPGERPKIKMMSPRGTEYIDTREHAGFAYINGVPFPFVVSLSSTGHGVSKDWMGLINSKLLPDGSIAPAAVALYRITSRLRNRGNQSWFVLSVADAGPLVEDFPTPLFSTVEQYNRGCKLHDAFTSGTKQAEAPHEEAESQMTYDAGSGGGQHAANGDDIPF